MSTPPALIKTRIAVAVARDGTWAAAGWTDGDPDELMDIAIENAGEAGLRFWVEAELPVPRDITVSADRVEKDYSQMRRIDTRSKSNPNGGIQ